jgi:hypothetical protein
MISYLVAISGRRIELAQHHILYNNSELSDLLWTPVASDEVDL